MFKNLTKADKLGLVILSIILICGIIGGIYHLRPLLNIYTVSTIFIFFIEILNINNKKVFKPPFFYINVSNIILCVLMGWWWLFILWIIIIGSNLKETSFE